MIIFSKRNLFLCSLTLAALATTGNPRSRSFSIPQSLDVIAHVRQGSEFCLQELWALNTRKALVQKSLEKIINKNLDDQTIPTIGVACSGGSVRAAIATLGFMRGLEKIGLLDAVSYWASLSGSTWTTAAWLVHDMSLEQLTKHLAYKLNNTFDFEKINEEAIIVALMKKLKTRGCFSLNDLWGSVIADIFLGTPSSSGQDVFLENLAEKTNSGTHPIPLFTSVIGETDPDYKWTEFSPFEVGSTYFNTWIPASAIGKQFNNGLSFDPLPSETLSFLLGLFGSAYAASIKDVLQAIKEDFEATYEIETPSCLAWIPFINNIRLSPPSVCNFVYGLEQCPLNQENRITFVDAGVATNLPFPPLFRRNVKIYFVCDASSDSQSNIGNEMREVEAYAKKHHYQFPKIDYKKLSTQPISIIADQDNPLAPIIIYVPNVQKFSLFKFDYSKEEFNQLMSNIETVIVQNETLIKQAIATTLKKGAFYDDIQTPAYA